MRRPGTAYIRLKLLVTRFFLQAIIFCVLLCLVLQLFSCKQTNAPVALTIFEDKPAAFLLDTLISEASGIADSKINPGYAWVEEDSGNPPQLYLLSHTGKRLKAIFLNGAVNRDWEDIALAAGPDPSINYLYVADIGDNDAVHTSSFFYRLTEPLAAVDTVRLFDRIEFNYADGPRDAEAFLVDGTSRDIYIISKRDAQSRVYKLAWPYSTSSPNTAVFVETLPYTGVVSAAISHNGKEIIVKTYTALFYYTKNEGENIAQALQKADTVLGYELEPQGEAVGFAADDKGFFTLSEKGNSSGQALFFYKRN